MDPQNLNQNNSDSKSINSGIKLFSIELLILTTLAIVILVVLNYFNILSLSRILPNQLGWLPRKEISGKISTATPKPTPVLAQEISIISYAKEVLKPEFMPALEPATIDYYKDQRYFKMENPVGNARIDLLYFESIGEKPLPMDINISIYSQGVPIVTKDDFKIFLEKYFINLPEIASTDISSFTIDDGGRVLEVVWDNPDGTKESRSILRFEKWREIEEPATFIQACRIFPDNPLYPKNTCFER